MIRQDHVGAYFNIESGWELVYIVVSVSLGHDNIYYSYTDSRIDGDCLFLLR